MIIGGPAPDAPRCGTGPARPLAHAGVADVVPVASLAGPVPVAGAAGVMPVIMAAAEFDPLRDEGAAAYADRLKNAGVPAEYPSGPWLIHGFAASLSVVDPVDANVRAILDMFNQNLGS
jgi:acetyl esterase/lipase